MGLTKKAQIKRAKDLGEAVAEEIFLSIQDPRYQGPSFELEGYPDMAARSARSQAFMSFPHHIEEEIENIAADAAHRKAKKILEEADKLSRQYQGKRKAQHEIS